MSFSPYNIKFLFYSQLIMKQKTNYEAPALEVMVLEIENAILATSGTGEDSTVIPGFGSSNPW